MGTLHDYLFNKRYSDVAGWLLDGAAWATFLLAEWQKTENISGDIAEIGVHHGKYFNLLSLLSLDTERSVAIDVFDQQSLNVDGSGKGDLALFLNSFELYDGRKSKLLVHQLDSLTLVGCDLTKIGCSRSRSPTRSFRLFSVDGSHTAKHTANDISIAFSVLRGQGVVIVDDFYNPQWPGVQQGVHAILSLRRDICAVAYGENKLFLVSEKDHTEYFDFFDRSLSEFYSHRKVVQLHGRKALSFSMNDPRGSFNPNLQRQKCRLSFGKTGNTDAELDEGWNAPEETGSWTSAKIATATIRMPRFWAHNRQKLRVQIAVYPYLHQNRKSRIIALCVNGSQGEPVEIQQSYTFQFIIDPATERQTISLVFNSDDPDVPTMVSVDSTDQRSLGLFVSRISFELI
jgi:hypothetical protein